MEIKKKGISPIISTVMLIAIAVLIASILLIYFLTWVPEAVTKNNRPIDRVCEEVAFTADYNPSTGDIIVVNNADVEIYAFDITKVMSSAGKEVVEDKKRATDALGAEIDIGKGGSGKISGVDMSSVDEIKILPVLLGKVEERNEPYTCKVEGVTIEI